MHYRINHSLAGELGELENVNKYAQGIVIFASKKFGNDLLLVA